MTDVRKCDGPNCDKEVALTGSLVFSYDQLHPDNFITVESRGKTMHFHTEQCMTDWAREVTTERGKRVSD